jgi:hypothetical protein
MFSKVSGYRAPPYSIFVQSKWLLVDVWAEIHQALPSQFLQEKSYLKTKIAQF